MTTRNKCDKLYTRDIYEKLMYVKKHIKEDEYEIKNFRQNNNELFVKQGLKIDCTYESEYSAGDKIYISANNCYFFKIQLDSALKETVVYAPSGSFEYRIPTEVLERIYEEGAFAGTEHRIRVSEATDKEAYGERNISLNPYDLQGQKDVIRTHMRIM